MYVLAFVHLAYQEAVDNIFTNSVHLYASVGALVCEYMYACMYVDTCRFLS